MLRNNNFKKFKNTKGITLIALVITIIVLIILAVVSVSMLTGQNGILTKATAASKAQKQANDLEQLQVELTKYNIDNFTDGATGDIKLLGELVKDKVIDNFLYGSGEFGTDTSKATSIPMFNGDTFTGQVKYIVKIGDNFFDIFSGSDGLYTAAISDITVADGTSISKTGTTIVTNESFHKNDDKAGGDENKMGIFTLEGTEDVIFTDTITGNLSIFVKSGAKAKVKIFRNTELTNDGLSRSAIDIQQGGQLDLYVAEGAVVTINSGYAKPGEKATGWNAKGGDGGYAGVHVPGSNTDSNGDGVIDYLDCQNDSSKCAILNLSGPGTIIAKAGDASDGNGSIGSGDSNTGGGGGRRCWSWNWWKWW